MQDDEFVVPARNHILLQIVGTHFMAKSLGSQGVLG
jgi:hypothetical protein